MCQNDDVKYKRAISFLHNSIKHGCDYDDAVKSIVIYLKTRRHAIPLTKVVKKTLEGNPACDLASKASKTMVAELINYASGNTDKLCV